MIPNYNFKFLYKIINILFIIFFIFAFSCIGKSKSKKHTDSIKPLLDTTAPYIIATSPADNSTDIPINTKITITFSESIDSTTITSDTFKVMNLSDSSFVQGEIIYSNTIAEFASNPELTPATQYSVTITSKIKDKSGNYLKSDYIFKFTTGAVSIPDLIPPQIILTNPLNGTVDVPLNTKITVMFSEPIDKTTLNSETFKIVNISGSATISGEIIYNENTATFIPQNNMSYNTQYTATLTTEIKDLSGNSLLESYSWSFTTGLNIDIVPLKITLTTPEKDAINVPISTNIVAIFTEQIDVSTITNDVFQVISNIDFLPIKGTVKYYGTTITFIPENDLIPGVVYTAIISKNIKDLSGNTLIENYKWSFTIGLITDTIPPQIIQTSPENKAIDISFSTNISALFSEPMDISTISSETFQIIKNIDNYPVAGIIMYNGTTLTFIPEENFEADTIYTAAITAKVKDLSGNEMGTDYVWSFTTGSISDTTPPEVISTTPESGDSNLPFNTRITATFSESINISTITTATFQIKRDIDNALTIGTVTYSGTTATFISNEDLIPDSKYIVTITTDIKDLSENNLKTAYIFTFNTGRIKDTTPPEVISTTPENNAINIAIDSKIEAFFSEPIEVSTINKATFFVKDINNSVISGTIISNETSITFIPDTILTHSSKYTITITTRIKDLSGNSLNTDYSIKFNTERFILWEKISAGHYHILAIKSDSSLWGWGYNKDGQVNSYITEKINKVSLLDNIYDWIEISAGEAYTIVIKSDNTLWAWGDNEFGQLGNVSEMSRLEPVQIGNDKWIKISAGETHTIAIKSDSTLWAWGNNQYSQLGDGTRINRNIPTKISTSPDWRTISTGKKHSAAIKSDNTLWMWGTNEYGQLGDGTNIEKNKPAKVNAAGKWAAVSLGEYHSIALKSDSTIWAWGNNEFGQLGIGTNENKNSPVQIGTDSNWIVISAGIYHTVALKSDGTIWAWGNNEFGQLGDNSTINKKIPTKIDDNNNWISIYAGGYYTIALKSDKSLWAWGDNRYGQMADKTKNIPNLINFDYNWKAIYAGGYHTILLKMDNTLWVSGNNLYGQMGNNTGKNLNNLTLFNTESDWQTISTGVYNILALKSDKTLWAWGDNEFGQLGDGTNENSDTPIKTGINEWESTFSGWYHSLAIKTDGTLWAWGNNSYGQLGEGSFVNKNLPVMVGIDNKWSIISAGEYHTIAIKSDSSLWAWGNNEFGQLGINNHEDSNSPVQIGDNNWTAISAGGNYTLALKSDGTLWAWGKNLYGQLGDNTNEDNASPIQINADNDWIAISAGREHSLALKSDGTLWAWGYNWYGQLGNDSIEGKNIPIQINNDNNWIAISAGAYHSLALKSDGSVWSWGYNGFGQLGNGSAWKEIPVQIKE